MQTTLSTSQTLSSGRKVCPIVSSLAVYVNDIVLEEVKRIVKECEILK